MPSTRTRTPFVSLLVASFVFTTHGIAISLLKIAGGEVIPPMSVTIAAALTIRRNHGRIGERRRQNLTVVQVCPADLWKYHPHEALYHARVCRNAFQEELV